MKKEPWIGFYHPGCNSVFQQKADYVRWYEKQQPHLKYCASKKVGIFFSRSQWIKKDMRLVNLLLEELEKRKIFPVAVFAQAREYGGPGCPGLEPGLKLLKGVDFIINLQSSFLVQSAIGKESLPGILEDIGVPIMQAVHESSRTETEWKENPQGLSPSVQIYWVAQPEFNGLIEPILVSAKDESRKSEGGFGGPRKPVKERIDFLIERISGWLTLSRIPPQERRVTFLLHNAPCAGVEASVGGGAGLDTLESVVRIMKQMKERGYKIENCPKDGRELIDIIMHRKAVSEFRWTTIDEIVQKGGVREFISVEKYNQWLDELSPATREKMISGWGNPPGEGMVYQGKIVVTGIKFGNVNVLVEPKRGCYGARCDGKVCKILHDPGIAPTHQCLATYKWAEENSDVKISVGTHGYIEFLPGKSVGLSRECFPEIITGKKPHLYIYTVANPAEGILAKRRASATIIDHMTPVMKPSGLYDKLNEMEELLKQWTQAKSLNQESRAKVILKDIFFLAEKSNLIEKGKEVPVENLIEYLHGKLNLFRETQINDGMHILSKIPDRKGIANIIVSILRFEGTWPSIRRLILETIGYNYGTDHSELLDRTTGIAFELVKTGLNIKLDKESRVISSQKLKKKISELMEVKNKDKAKELIRLIMWAAEVIYPKLKMVKGEIPQLLRAFDKEYIRPGASGHITRGKIEVLPTGRNLYSMDTRAIPTKAAWEVGIKMAQGLLDKYRRDDGKYPENIGMVLWSIDAYLADGEQISKILYLIGARPVWMESGIVKGTEVIPLKELGRPRLDVTIRTSGIFRDTLPHIIELLDEAICKIANLDESDEDNFVKKHGAGYRIFCARPGGYGNGVSLMIAASAWENMKDLGEIYIERGGYAYGKGVYGKASHNEYAHRLSSVEVVFHKLPSDEFDILSCCSFFDFQGGMYSAVKSLSGKEPRIYWGDTKDPQRPKIRDLKDEIEKSVRTRLLNPAWIEGMKRHGYKGAGDISKRIGHVYGWDASAEVVADWIFDDIAKAFVLNDENRKFFEDNNPWAMEEISRRLLEAEKRGIWKADPDVLRELRNKYLEIEGWIEEKMGDVQGEFQGGNIDIITKNEIEDWAKKSNFDLEEFLKTGGKNAP
ncbi:hypothetical protein AUJ66_07125 [Candidatus Desantisbacteria bacterium CG1_02_38_46]|uniref:CobN/magnesium chelatase domain-containing protein n=2 Tax=unclassified Candidatus Desantisiibacteriota TaxID=3106372 RepID=A0A1J4SA69_9BACT|nr:MAG: hypothetical protein AUJ66_07125 [Candidatus Desantisbacteria bacterium CG1_02_38_46]PIU51812.1 MAG: cobalt chelatase [Candidatus Desantisbacteria bacterium CG07_land_8_20_14_0_80_39_15]